MNVPIICNPMTWEAFQVTYRPHIRLMVDWDGLEAYPPEVILVACPRKLYYPWYSGHRGRDGWRDGQRVQAPPGTEPTFFRAPAATYRRQTMLLDGCHRYRALRPAFLVLDTLVVTKDNHRFFTEFL